MNRRQILEQRLKDAPDDPFLQYTYALELAKLGEIDASRKAFAQVRQLDPQYLAAWFQEAQILARHGMTNEAAGLLREGIDVAKRVGDSHALGEMTEFLENL